MGSSPHHATVGPFGKSPPSLSLAQSICEMGVTGSHSERQGGFPGFSSRDAALKTHYRGHSLKLVYSDSLSGACSFQNYPNSRVSVLTFHIHHPSASKKFHSLNIQTPPGLLLQSPCSDILFLQDRAPSLGSEDVVSRAPPTPVLGRTTFRTPCDL